MIKDKKVSNIALYNTTQYQVGFLGTLGNVDKEENWKEYLFVDFYFLEIILFIWQVIRSVVSVAPQSWVTANFPHLIREWEL